MYTEKLPPAVKQFLWNRSNSRSKWWQHMDIVCRNCNWHYCTSAPLYEWHCTSAPLYALMTWTTFYLYDFKMIGFSTQSFVSKRVWYCRRADVLCCWAHEDMTPWPLCVQTQQATVQLCCCHRCLSRWNRHADHGLGALWNVFSRRNMCSLAIHTQSTHTEKECTWKICENNPASTV
jgi:hypothetical protein